jgi:hypothetical protein
MKLIKLLVVVGFILAIFNPVFVLAQQTTTTTSKTTAPASQTALPKYSGVDSSLKNYLCTPSEQADGKDLERCINRLYRFSLSAGALVLVFFLVLAGYLYITSGETGKTKAKSILMNSISGMAILAGSYLLLYFINPSLVAFKPIQPPVFTTQGLPSCKDLGLGDGCIVATSNTGNSGPGNGAIVAIAMAELGKRGNGNNRGPEIEKYFSPGGTLGQPWCAYFATWVYGQAGIKTLGNLPGRGGTLTLVNYFRNNNGKQIPEGTLRYFSAVEVNNNSFVPQPGDLALFDRGTEGDPNGHTAIVLGYDPATKNISTIDGNQGQSDEVKKVIRNINRDCTGGSVCRLIGIGRVQK